MEPNFNPKALSGFLPVFNEGSKTFVKVLEEKLDGDEFDIFHYFGHLTLDNISRTTAGMESDTQTVKDHEYYVHVYK